MTTSATRRNAGFWTEVYPRDGQLDRIAVQPHEGQIHVVITRTEPSVNGFHLGIGLPRPVAGELIGALCSYGADLSGLQGAELDAFFDALEAWAGADGADLVAQLKRLIRSFHCSPMTYPSSTPTGRTLTSHDTSE